MKANNIFISTTAIALVMVIASVTFYSCKKKPFDGIDRIVGYSFTETVIGVSFEDAVTEELVGFNDAAVDVNVSVVGKDADKIVSITSEKDLTCTDGILMLALAKGVSSSDDNPIEFTIVGEADGYVTASLPVTISGESSSAVTVSMVSLTNAPAGVAVKIDKTSLGVGEAGGVTGTSAPIAISSGAATSGSDATTATINIPTGQMFYTDATKSERVTDAIEVTMAKFSPTEGAALDNFPGSLSATFTDNTAAQFITAGLISLDMKTASGKEVTFFEKPISVTSGIPAGVTKPDGTALAAGDTIPVWSHSKTTGLWTYEGNTTVVDNGGKLEATYSITHLSLWNVDYQVEQCAKGATVNFTGEVSTGLFNIAVMYGEDGKFAAFSTNMNPIAGTSDRLLKSSNEQVQIVLMSYSYYIKLFNKAGSRSDMKISDVTSTNVQDVYGRSGSFNGCTGSTTIDVKNPNMITLNATATCGGGSTVYKPSIPVFLSDVTAGETEPKQVGEMKDGKFRSDKLIKGHTYNMYTYYKGELKPYEFKVNANGDDVNIKWEFSQNFCNAFKDYLSQ